MIATTRRVAVLLALAAALSVSALAADYQTNVNTIIARHDKTIIGQSVEVPKNPTIIFSTSTFAPGARTPEHKHPWPHYICVQEGVLTIVGTEIGQEFALAKGCYVEMIDKWHYGINKGSVPVVTLVIDQVPPGIAKNNVPKDGK